MHEYSIVQALLDRVETEARARQARSDHALTVRIGTLSGVEPELLASAYDLCREGTICGRALLTIERAEARWACPACDWPIANGDVLRCPACGVAARLFGGDEIVLQRIEMEVA